MSEYKRCIDRVVALLQEEIEKLDRLNDELTEESPVWPQFELEQTCLENLLRHALEEQERINEIWKAKKKNEENDMV